MSKTGYTLTTGAAVALAPAVPKTVLCVIAPSTFGVDLKKMRVSFDGVTASAVPVLIEILNSTLASNSTPGTGNTIGTVNQAYGCHIPAGFTGFYNSTVEPTVLTSIDAYTLTPTGGTLLYDWPLGDTPDTIQSNGIVLRCTAPAVVNVRAAFWFERC